MFGILTDFINWSAPYLYPILVPIVSWWNDVVVNGGGLS